MRKLHDYKRASRLIREIIQVLDLDLSGISVLTETGSGAFVLTPIIAAMAGSECVVAVTRDSQYGPKEEVKSYIDSWSKATGTTDRIYVSFSSPMVHASKADLVTNLGFVRPINEKFITLLPQNAVIALMWEPWEYRSTDLDLIACQKNKIPVLGTNECDPRLQIFTYVGMMALKLLFEADIEIFRSKIVVIGSGHFGLEIDKAFKRNGSECLLLDPLRDYPVEQPETFDFLKSADAIVVAEHRYRKIVLGGNTGLPIKIMSPDVKIIHICGNIPYQELRSRNIKKKPEHVVEPGYMTVTTDYLGPKPVIDLHAAGLKVGESLHRGMKRYKDMAKAKEFALANSPAMDF